MYASVVCIGATLIDEIYFSQSPFVEGTSNPASGALSMGGVMTNVARHLAALKVPVALLTAVGNDATGLALFKQLKATGIQMDHALQVAAATGKYIAFHQPNGDLFTAICCDQATAAITPDYLTTKIPLFNHASCIVADTNLSSEVLQWLTNQATQHNWVLIIDPVSVAKAAKLADVQLNNVALLTPNEEELHVLGSLDDLFLRGVQAVWVRKGNSGSTLYTTNSKFDLGVPKIDVIDTTGAGDAALAGWLYAQIHGKLVLERMCYGHALALHQLQRKGAVDPNLTPQHLEQLKLNYYP